MAYELLFLIHLPYALTKFFLKRKVQHKNVHKFYTTKFLFYRCEDFWTISSIDNFVFCTYFGAIQIQVFPNETTGMVHDLIVENKLGEGTKPIAHFVHSIYMRKLEKAAIFKSLGEKFTILSLLDYISITMQCMLDYNMELRKFGTKNLFEMTYDYRFVCIFIDKIDIL